MIAPDNSYSLAILYDAVCWIHKLNRRDINTASSSAVFYGDIDVVERVPDYRTRVCVAIGPR